MITASTSQRHRELIISRRHVRCQVHAREVEQYWRCRKPGGSCSQQTWAILGSVVLNMLGNHVWPSAGLPKKKSGFNFSCIHGCNIFLLWACKYCDCCSKFWDEVIFENCYLIWSECPRIWTWFGLFNGSWTEGHWTNLHESFIDGRTVCPALWTFGFWHSFYFMFPPHLHLSSPPADLRDDVTFHCLLSTPWRCVKSTCWPTSCMLHFEYDTGAVTLDRFRAKACFFSLDILLKWKWRMFFSKWQIIMLYKIIINDQWFVYFDALTWELTTRARPRIWWNGNASY